MAKSSLSSAASRGAVPIAAIGALATAFGVLALLALSAPATAQTDPTAAPSGGPVATARNDTFGGAPPDQPAGPIAMAARRYDDSGYMPMPMGPCGGGVDPKTGKLDMSPHGEVFAGVGSAGYREAGGTVCVPLKDNMAARISVDVGRFPYYGWGPY